MLRDWRGIDRPCPQGQAGEENGGMISVQYSTSPAFASQIIRRLTHSRWSHIDIVMVGNGLLGVSGPDKTIDDLGGVRIRPFNCWPYVEKPLVVDLLVSDDVARKIVEFAVSQVGRPFDNGALYAFLSDPLRIAQPRDWRDPAQWFCSEFAIRSFEIGGVFPYKLATHPSGVSPHDSLLLLNPYMTDESIDHALTALEAPAP
jgi:hypothetical protein